MYYVKKSKSDKNAIVVGFTLFLKRMVFLFLTIKACNNTSVIFHQKFLRLFFDFAEIFCISGNGNGP